MVSGVQRSVLTLDLLTQITAPSPSDDTNIPNDLKMATRSVQSDQADTPPVKTLNTFPLFPNLPTELRLQIWRLSFPRGRQVNFAAFRTNISPRHSEVIRKQDLLSSPLPITLFVNKESRKETMKHYLVVSRRGYTGNLRTEDEQPFCYNPNLDVAWIAPITIMRHYPEHWMAYLKSKAPQAFSKTKVLEVRFWEWECAFNLDGIHGEKGINHASVSSYVNQGRQINLFLNFTSLEHVKLIRNFDFHPVNLTNLRHKNENDVRYLAARIRDWFEENENTFVGGAPLVTVEEKEVSCA
jgi:hypothetical protein